MGTNGNDIFYSHPEVSVKWGSRKGFILSLEIPPTLPFIRKDWLWKQRGMWSITSTPALLLWAFSWKVPKTHSVLFCFHPIQTWPNKGIMCCPFSCLVAPLLLKSMRCWQHGRKSQLNRKSDSVSHTVSAISASEWPPGYTPYLESHTQTHTPASHPRSTLIPRSLLMGQERCRAFMETDLQSPNN